MCVCHTDRNGSFVRVTSSYEFCQCGIDVILTQFVIVPLLLDHPKWIMMASFTTTTTNSSHMFAFTGIVEKLVSYDTSVKSC